MCYVPDLESNFRWRSLDELPSVEHIYLVSDGKLIGIAFYDGFDEENENWQPIWSDKIDATTYFGGFYKDEERSIYVNNIKYWMPIPSLSLQKKLMDKDQ